MDALSLSNRLVVLFAAIVLLGSCEWGERTDRARGQATNHAPTTATEPERSGDAAKRTTSNLVTRNFAATNVSRVVFRAADARSARVQTEANRTIVVSGQPKGGAPDYHPSGEWRETPASEWGLDFRAKLYGDTLVISTFNEIHYIHHNYYFDELSIAVPKGVQVILEPRQLSGEGAPNLREPTKDAS